MLNAERKKKLIEETRTARMRRKKSALTGNSVSQQKKQDDKNNVQDETYKTIIENIPCVVYSAFPGKTGPTTFMSNKWKDWTGYSPEELYHDPEAWPKCIHPDDRETAVNAYSKACQENIPFNLEYRVVHKETEQVRYLRDQGLFSKDKKDNIIRIDGIITDISELKRSKKSQRESEKKFRNFLENLGDVAYEADTSGNVTYSNSMGEKVTGVPLKDIVGKPFLPLFTKESQEEAIDVYERTLNGESTEFELTFKNGRICQFKNEPLRDDDGKITGVFGIARDITERKHIEEELRRHRDHLEEMVAKRTYELEKSNETLLAEITERKQTEEALKMSEIRFRSLIEQTTDAVFCYEYDPPIATDLPLEQQVRLLYDGILVECNDICAKSYGADRAEDVIGRRLTELFGAMPGSLDELFRKMIEGEYRTVDGEGVEKLENGTNRYYLNNGHGVIEDGKLVRVWGTFRDVTESKQAEKALKESESRFRELVENMHEVFWMENADGTELLYVSPMYEKVWGRSCQSFYENPQQWIESIHPEDRQRITEAFSQLRKAGEYSEEFRIVRPDGTIRWIWDRGVLIRNESDEVVNVAGVAEDVTERRQTEGALRESEEKFRSLAEQSPNMIFINKSGKIVYVNKKCEEVMGYKREEFYSPDFDFRTLIAPESLGLINDNFARHLRGEEVQTYDYCLINKNGERIEAINTSKLIQYEGETAILGVVTDITERKRAEQALRDSAERLKILFESAPDAIYLIDSEGKIVDGNRASVKLIGFTKEEVIGKSLAKTGLLSGEQLSRAEANLKKVAAGELSGPNEYVLKRKDGTHVSIEVRTFPVNIEGKMLTLGIARDITLHKQTERVLLEHQAKLKSLASQLSLTEERERHRLATDLHDQISQSLVISKIKLDQLRKSSSSDEFNEPLKDISNCLERVIDDTRALTFDLSYPILYELGFEAAVAEWLAEQIQEKHGLETHFEDDEQQKPLDDDIQVLLFRNVRELLINAVKHAHAQKVKLSVRRVDDHIHVSVEDDGAGFDPVEVSSTAAQKAKFGLFSIRERLEQLGGFLEIKSEPGHGSKITMTAPLKQTDGVRV